MVREANYRYSAEIFNDGGAGLGIIFDGCLSEGGVPEMCNV